MSHDRPSDKRQFGRRESAIHAVALIAGRAPAHCIVRNYSDRGALLEFKEPLVPPYRFRLQIEAKGVDVLCEVRHQGTYGVGVYFAGGSIGSLLDAPSPPSAQQAAPLSRQSPQRASGSELRSSLFGSRQAEPEPVREIRSDTGRLIRGT